MGHLQVAQCRGGTTFSGLGSGMLDMLSEYNSFHNEYCPASLEYVLHDFNMP